MTSIRAPQIDLTSVIKRYAVETDLTLESRSADAGFQGGRWYEGEAVTASIVAAVQPLGSKELQALPEGYRTQDGIVVYSTSEVVPQGNRDSTNRGDVLLWKGVRYDVVQVEAWDTNGRYWRAVATRSDQ